MDKEYVLYRWDREDLRGHVALYIEDEENELMMVDYTIGSTCESFWGETDRELTLTIDAERAGKLLAYLKLEAAGDAIKTLGKWMRSEYKGCSDAATRFRELSEKAGVKVDVFAW